MQKKTRILILGVSGMLGSAAYRLLGGTDGIEVFGTSRGDGIGRHFRSELRSSIISGVDVENTDTLAGVLRDARPDVVINCIGIVKQLATAKDPLVALPINSILPHRLARLCSLVGARLIHVSTDCVFSGRRGAYKETDQSDAYDLYGRSKLLGEVDYDNAITLRTSIIGREVASSNGLVEWFLSSKGEVRGFTKAIFSGLTTDELTRVILNHVLPQPQLRGVYHVSSDPIDKYSLLQLVRETYGCPIEIEPDDSVVIDRSLDSTRFRQETAYAPPSWQEMINAMREFGATEGARG